MYYKLSRGSLSSVDNPPLLLPIKYHIYIYYERCRATGKFDSINVKYVDSLYVYVQCEALAHIFPLQAAGIINSTAKIIHWKSNRTKIAAENCQFRAALVASLCGAIQKFPKFSRDTQEHLSFQIHILIWWHSLWCHFWFELFVIKFSIFSSACFSLSLTFVFASKVYNELFVMNFSPCVWERRLWWPDVFVQCHSHMLRNQNWVFPSFCCETFKFFIFLCATLMCASSTLWCGEIVSEATREKNRIKNPQTTIFPASELEFFQFSNVIFVILIIPKRGFPNSRWNGTFFSESE